MKVGGVSLRFIFSRLICYQKFAAEVWYIETSTNIDTYTVAGSNDGPCPAGIRFRDLCIHWWAPSMAI